MTTLQSRVLDNGLNVLVAEADRFFICSAEPTDFTLASSTLRLGVKVGVSGGGGIFFTLANALPDGRKVSLANFVDGSITSTGIASHWAACDQTHSRLLATGPVTTATQVTSGNTFSMTAFDVAIGSRGANVLNALGVTTVSPAIGNPLLTQNVASGFPDGFTNRPAGVAAQYPTLLNGLTRPAWNVPGVDYGVGYPAAFGTTTLWKLPGTGANTANGTRTATPAGCSLNQSTHNFTVSGSGMVLDGWDFSVDGGWHVDVTGTNCVVQNCNFRTGTNLLDMFDMSSGIVQYCVFDGNSTLTSNGPNGPFGPTSLNLGGGSCSVFYCWIKNSVWDHMDLHGNGSNNYTIRFNLLDNGGRGADPNAHNDWVQTYSQFSGDPGYGNIVVEFNTMRQTPNVLGGTGTQGWTLQMNSNVPIGPGIGNVLFNNNVTVDTSNGMNYHFAYDLTAVRGSYSVNNNYMSVPENLGTNAFHKPTAADQITGRSAAVAIRR